MRQNFGVPRAQTHPNIISSWVCIQYCPIRSPCSMVKSHTQRNPKNIILLYYIIFLHDHESAVACKMKANNTTTCCNQIGGQSEIHNSFKRKHIKSIKIHNSYSQQSHPHSPLFNGEKHMCPWSNTLEI